MARQTTSSGTTTTSVYVGSLAEYDTTGSTTTTTDYFRFAGQTVAIRDTAWHYLVADQLGTPEVQLNASGTPELLQLKLPYGAGRYAAASLANLGFTGQRKDTSPNLTYFNARYYDQDVGVFLSPDSVRDGPNPYAYVGGMVENATDPSGHMQCDYACEGGGATDLSSIADVTSYIQINFTERGGGAGMSGVNPSAAGGAGRMGGGATLSSDPLSGYDLSGNAEVTTNADGSHSVESVTDDPQAMDELAAQEAHDQTIDTELRSDLGGGRGATHDDPAATTSAGPEKTAGGSPTATTDKQGFPESEQLPYTSKGQVFGQKYDGSCVAACGKMVLSDSGVDVPEAWVRQFAGVDPEAGGSISNLPQAIETLGGPTATFESGGTLENLQADTASGNSVVVSIVQPGLRHAIVVDGFAQTDIGTTVLIRDPLEVGSGSQYQVLVETFMSAWTGEWVHF